MSQYALAADDRLGLPSASGYERFFHCAGSWQLEKTMPPLPPTPEATTGDKTHAMLGGDETVVLNDDELRTFELCERLATEILSKWADGAKTICYYERRIPFVAGFETRMTGRFDRLYLEERQNGLMLSERGLLIDFKTGHLGATLASGNMQLRCLAVMAARHYGFNHVTAAIVQPNASPQTSLVEYDEMYLTMAATELERRLEAAARADARRVPGSWCKYCRAQSVCPELREAGLAIAPLPQPSALLELSGAQIGALLDRCALAEQAVDVVRAEAHRRLEHNPDSLPGWRLKAGRFIETIVDPQKVFERVFELGMDNTEFLDCVKIGKEKLSALLKTATGKKGKELAALLDDVLAGCVDVKQARPSLEKIKEIAS